MLFFLPCPKFCCQGLCHFNGMFLIFLALQTKSYTSCPAGLGQATEPVKGQCGQGMTSPAKTIPPDLCQAPLWPPGPKKHSLLFQPPMFVNKIPRCAFPAGCLPTRAAPAAAPARETSRLEGWASAAPYRSLHRAPRAFLYVPKETEDTTDTASADAVTPL